MKIVIHAEHPEPLAEQLEQEHPDNLIKTCDNYEGLPELIEAFRPDAVFSIRFAGTPGFPAQSLTGKTGPGWIHIGGSGTDHLGLWDTGRTTVTNSAGVAAPAMAEYAMGAFLHFSLDVPGLLKDKTNKTWNSRSISVLSGKTVLIIGLGNTGQAVAKLANAFGMEVIGTRSRPADTPYVSEVHSSENLPDLLPRADFIVVSVPLYDATKRLLDHQAFCLLKPEAVLVDLSRGGIVVEDALREALSNGQIKGAALDVFETEPLPEDNPLWSFDNVLISPHCSSVFDGWEAASMEIFCENLSRLKNSEPLMNVVTPQ